VVVAFEEVLVVRTGNTEVPDIGIARDLQSCAQAARGKFTDELEYRLLAGIEHPMAYQIGRGIGLIGSDFPVKPGPTAWGPLVHEESRFRSSCNSAEEAFTRPVFRFKEIWPDTYFRDRRQTFGCSHEQLVLEAVAAPRAGEHWGDFRDYHSFLRRLRKTFRFIIA